MTLCEKEFLVKFDRAWKKECVRNARGDVASIKASSPRQAVHRFFETKPDRRFWKRTYHPDDYARTPHSPEDELIAAIDGGITIDQIWGLI